MKTESGKRTQPFDGLYQPLGINEGKNIYIGLLREEKLRQGI